MRSSVGGAKCGITEAFRSPIFMPTKSAPLAGLVCRAKSNFSGKLVLNGLVGSGKTWFLGTKRHEVLLAKTVSMPSMSRLICTMSKVVTLPDRLASAAMRL